MLLFRLNIVSLYQSKLIEIRKIKSIANEGIANAFGNSSSAGTKSQAIILAVKQSFVEGWQQAMWIGVVVMLILLVYVLLAEDKMEN